MKKSIFLLSVLLAFSCKEGFEHCPEDEMGFENKATITGMDERKCACCGGYFIEIDGSTYRFYEENLPANDVDLIHSKLPLEVRLDWESTEQGDCGTKDLISIQKIEKIEDMDDDD